MGFAKLLWSFSLELQLQNYMECLKSNSSVPLTTGTDLMLSASRARIVITVVNKQELSYQSLRCRDVLFDRMV